MHVENELEPLKAQIRPHLEEFIEEQGIEVNRAGMMRCLHPMHGDSTPSMKLLKDLNSEMVYCYGCGAHGDIFTVNEWLHDVPSHGAGFIRENLYGLADKYSIPYTEIEFSEEQLEVFDRIRVNKAVCTLLNATTEDGEPSNWTLGHATSRGWKEDVCKTLDIRTVLDYDRFIRDLSRATSIDPLELKEKYDIRGQMFGPECITIPIYDHLNQPVAFTARWLKWSSKEKRPKYSNSHNSVAFQKSKVLYGMHLTRKHRGKRLDVFEGNGSYITALGAGHRSSVAIMSSDLSEDQVNLIQKMGFTHVNLCLDADATGIKKTDKMMESLSGREGLRVTCTKLPDGYDPDDYILEHDLSSYYQLGTTSAFEFMLTKHISEAREGDTPGFIAKMIKVIMNTPNRIERGQQIKSLAEITKVPEEDIRDEMKRLMDLSVDKIKKDLTQGVHYAKDTDELLTIIDRTRRSVEETSGSRNEKQNLSDMESLESFEDMVSTMRTREPGIQGWQTGFSLLDDRLSGIKKPLGKDEAGHEIPMAGTLFGLGGASQHGKSTVLLNLTLNMALLNEDISVLYWALDDSRELLYERIIAMHSGVPWDVVTKREMPTPEQSRLIDESVEKISTLIASGRFVVKDQTNGRSIPMLQRWIENSYKEHNRPICVVIDSFHKISTTTDQASLAEAAKAKAHSEELKSLYKTHNCTIICSLEVNKAATRGVEPDMLNITETRKIEFDFDIVGMVFNHYFDTDGDSNLVIMDGDIPKPVIKVNIRKSKQGGTGPIYFVLDPRTFRLKAYSLNDIKRLTETEEVKTQELPGARLVPPDQGELAPVRSDSVMEPWKS